MQQRGFAFGGARPSCFFGTQRRTLMGICQVYDNPAGCQLHLYHNQQKCHQSPHKRAVQDIGGAKKAGPCCNPLFARPPDRRGCKWYMDLASLPCITAIPSQ
jgi:hypothetical protein